MSNENRVSQRRTPKLSHLTENGLDGKPQFPRLRETPDLFRNFTSSFPTPKLLNRDRNYLGAPLYEDENKNDLTAIDSIYHFWDNVDSYIEIVHTLESLQKLPIPRREKKWTTYPSGNNDKCNEYGTYEN